jgi:hypothetical protein
MFPNLFTFPLPTTGDRNIDDLIVSIIEPIAKSFVTDNLRNGILKLWRITKPYLWILNAISDSNTVLEIKNNLEEQIKNPTKKIKEYEKITRPMFFPPGNIQNQPIILA